MDTDPRYLYAIRINDEWLSCQDQPDTVLLFTDETQAMIEAVNRGGNVIRFRLAIARDHFIKVRGPAATIVAFIADKATRLHLSGVLTAVCRLTSAPVWGKRGLCTIFPYIEDETEELRQQIQTILNCKVKVKSHKEDAI